MFVNVPVPVQFPVKSTAGDSGGDWIWLNLAVTTLSASIFRVHVPVPEQAPDHPEKVEPACAVAVSVTVLPAGKLMQLMPQFRLEAEELAPIVPLPSPEVVIVRLNCWAGEAAKFAVTD